jgi:transposase
VLFDAHTRSFAALGGIPQRGIYDNMKTAVDKVKKGKGRVVNARFSVMCALRRYARRWLVERFFAWLQWKRRLLVRWEYYANNFLGFVQLASITMMLKRF